MKLIALGSQKCLGDATKMCLFKVCKIQILHHNLPKIFMRIFSIFQVLQLTHNWEIIISVDEYKLCV